MVKGWHKRIVVNIKNVILKRPHNYLEPGLEYTERKRDNGEIHMSLTGSKQQINRYLQDAPILSERLRTLNNVPHYRIINTHKVEIY